MTEITGGIYDPVYGDGQPKVTGPKDEYHEPYPGYFERQAKKEAAAQQVKQAQNR